MPSPELRKQSESALSEFMAGVKAELPIIVGVIPFGVIFGVLAIAAGLPPQLAQMTSMIIFAGSAQFIDMQLIAIGTPAPVIWITTLIINLRHLLYSASLAPHTHHLSARWRWLLAYLLTDEAYVVTAVSFEQAEHRPNKHYFWLGSGLTLWVNWQFWTAVGIVFGTQIPESWSLDFALALTFIGMVVPLLRNRPMLAAALTAGLTAVLANNLPYKLGLMLAALVGILVGVLLESLQKTEPIAV